MRKLQAFQDAVITRNVVARFTERTSASATPLLDKLFNDRSKVETTIGAAMKKLNPLADKVEKSPEDFELLGKMVDAAYLVFAPFRAFIDKGQRELDALKGAEFQAAKEARNLYSMLKTDLNKSYNAVAQAKQDKDEKSSAKAAHDLTVTVNMLKTIFKQYVEAYGK